MTYAENCPFCNPMKDNEQNIIFENETCYFLQHNKEQDVLEGCGVIVPKKHHANAFKLTKKEWNDTYELLQNVKEYLDKEFSPDGYTLGWNVGEVSNQSIFHSHLHVIPRYNDEPLAGKGVRYWLKQSENKREKLKLKNSLILTGSLVE
ncbi:HIT family protein [Neobacillus sp. SCS-31]|uniref:HIT family protein n=1 Tax=Neobacillus oceani TaxID=3115292 RepID=UPI00390695C3